MAFKSQAQRRKLYATNPKLAAEFEAKTLSKKKLPERVISKRIKEKLIKGSR